MSVQLRSIMAPPVDYADKRENQGMQLKKRIKKWVIGVLIMSEIITSSALTACGHGDQRQKEAEKLLADKYNEEFVVTSYNGQKVMQDYYTVSAYAKSHPTIPFEASVTEDGTSVSDDYVSRRVCAAVSEHINLNLTALPFTYFVHTGIMSGDSICSDPDVSVEEFATEWEPYNRYYVYLYLPEDISQSGADAGQVYSVLANALSDLPQIKGNLSVYVSDDDMLAKVSEYVESNTGLYNDYFKMTQDDFRGQFDFENGSLAITQSDVEALLSH